MATRNQLKAGVIGSTGYAGSHACVELLSRGHLVTGISRNPGKLGSHPHYSGKSLDFEKASIAELVEAFSGYDVLVKYPTPLLVREN
jgi:putative NADH-flavin reductase